MMRFIATISFLLLLSCSEQKGQKSISDNDDQRIIFLAQIEQLADTLAKSQSSIIDHVKAKRLVDNSILFVDKYPEDKRSPELLFRAAEVSVGMEAFEESLVLWQRLRKHYPDHPKSIEALFFQGFTCDNQLRDKERSANYYKKFLSQHPSHELAPQAKLLLEQLSVSPEELIRQFKENQGN